MKSDEPIDSDESMKSNGRSDDWYRKRAKEYYRQEGEIEVESNASVSVGSDEGAYVEAWVWVSNN